MKTQKSEEAQDSYIEEEITEVNHQNDLVNDESFDEDATQEISEHYTEDSEQDEVAELKEHLARRMAEFENFKKRLTKEKEEVVKFANEKLLLDIFPVLDSLEMALSNAKDTAENDPIKMGVSMVLKQFLEVLKKHGLEEISEVGTPFDPNVHEAISTQESSDYEPDTVITIHRKGYKLKDRLIRAAMVTVSQ